MMRSRTTWGGMTAGSDRVRWAWAPAVVTGALVVGLCLVSGQIAPRAFGAPAAGPDKADAKGKAVAAKTAEQSAEGTIAAAAQSLQAGKADAAIEQLSGVIAGGKLPQGQMARALYYRGLAYRKQNKPAQAIADLTSALWIKNGLDTTQRNDALLNRAGAYRDAGLTDQAEADEQRVAASAPAAKPAVDQAAASQPGEQPSKPARSAAAGEDAAAATTPSSTGGLGSLFGSLFGAAPATEQSQQTQPAIAGEERAAGWSTRAARTAEAASDWDDNTRIRRAAQPAAAQPVTTGSTTAGRNHSGAPAPSAAPAPAVSAKATRGPAGAGRYHLLVAAVRSRKEAEVVAGRLQSIGAAELDGRQAQIEETVVGNMGTLYRVRVGPFADAGRLQNVCPRLRSAGMDCLITDP